MRNYPKPTAESGVATMARLWAAAVVLAAMIVPEGVAGPAAAASAFLQ